MSNNNSLKIINNFQCELSKQCKNTKCFWNLRDKNHYSAFELFDNGMHNKNILNKFNLKQENIYFPKIEFMVGTNIMYNICNDFI